MGPCACPLPSSRMLFDGRLFLELIMLPHILRSHRTFDVVKGSGEIALSARQSVQPSVEEEMSAEVNRARAQWSIVKCASSGSSTFHPRMRCPKQANDSICLEELSAGGKSKLRVTWAQIQTPAPVLTSSSSVRQGFSAYLCPRALICERPPALSRRKRSLLALNATRRFRRALARDLLIDQSRDMRQPFILIEISDRGEFRYRYYSDTAAVRTAQDQQVRPGCHVPMAWRVRVCCRRRVCQR